MYSMLTFLTLLSLVLLHHALNGSGAKCWAGFCGAALATLHTHNYGTFGVTACTVYALLVLKQHRKAIKPLVLAVAAIAVGYSPWFLFMLAHQIRSRAIKGWIPDFQWQMVPETLLYYAGLNMFLFVIFSLVRKLREANQELTIERKTSLDKKEMDTLLRQFVPPVE